MRKLVFAVNQTLDGCCDHTKQFVDDEILEHFTELTREADMQVFGRKTYELMVPYWPDVLKRESASKADAAFARAFDALRKVVFSRTLERAEGENTRIVSTDPCEEVRRLKREPGRDILVGGVEIPTLLMQHGLIDEYRLVVSPIIAGEGRRLFDGASMRERLALKLVESKTLRSGCVVLRFVNG